MNFYNTYIYKVAKLLSTVVGAVVFALMTVGCDEKSDVVEVKSEAYIQNTEIRGSPSRV